MSVVPPIESDQVRVAIMALIIPGLGAVERARPVPRRSIRRGCLFDDQRHPTSPVLLDFHNFIATSLDDDFSARRR